MQNLGERMIHRLKLLDNTDDSLKDDNFQNSLQIEKLDERISNELTVIKHELKMLSKECDTLSKAVFAMGKLLKEKATAREFNEFQDKVNEWPLEDFITTKELDQSFHRYAKKHHK